MENQPWRIPHIMFISREHHCSEEVPSQHTQHVQFHEAKTQNQNIPNNAQVVDATFSIIIFAS